MPQKPSTLTKDERLRYAPAHSVFVAANAGSGKTSSLTRRVLSLLMHGVAPSKILCLTFTNGAAAEMSTRIIRTLGGWVMMEETALAKALAEFLSIPITPPLLARARSLFAHVLDDAVGLRLQTIHGFCQSLLARFPLEAGVGMHLKVMDDNTRLALLREARLQLFAQHDHNALLHTLVQQLGEHSLLEFLGNLVQQGRKLTRFIDAQHGLPFALTKIYENFGIARNMTLETLIAEHLPRDAAHLAQLREIASALLQRDNASNQDTGKALMAWLDREDFAAYQNGFLTTSYTPRKTLFVKGSLHDEHDARLRQEQERILMLTQKIFSLQDAQLTANLLTLGTSILEHYNRLKQQHGLMDFDDQISATIRLLSHANASAWVMYKLDGGIDHALVDEAQDTSPDQWQIIRTLVEEFFAGKGRKEIDRSLFVVGDEKQSIFRFQGADPSGLAQNRQAFLQQLSDADMPGQVVALTHSYRSAPEILALVDALFSNPVARQGLSADDVPISHQPIRTTAQGYCELWPLAEADGEGRRSASFMLAQQIASEIAAWVAQGMSPGDVMVLVRKRSGGFMYQLSRALKQKNIAVAGVDRMQLLKNLAVQDLLAFAQILLLPEDDLTLAALLKSPLFNLSEEEIFSLCNERQNTLWEALSQPPFPAAEKAYTLLSEFRAKVDYLSPYALFCELLNARGYRRRITGRMGADMHEVLDVFLEQCLLFEQAATPSMQGFLGWIQSGDSEVKRDMEHAGAQVRIMTVHGAKGLQAKRVIVADTTSALKAPSGILWQDAPFATLNSKTASLPVQAARLREQTLEMEEYRRLLYVALTRAEDVLIVCGAKSGNSAAGVADGAWYLLAAQAFETLGRKLENNRIAIGSMPTIHKHIAAHHTASAPLILYGTAPQEQNPPRPLAPSQLTTPTPAAASPLTDATLVEKGIAIHRILQYAPAHIEKGEETLKKLAYSLAQSHAPSLPETAQKKLATDAIAVLFAPEFAPLFSTTSMAEVPISGTVQWRGETTVVLGQIDRLVATDNEVWIVDYKSSAHPPATPPEAYVQQMALYRAVLSKIYPNHRIRAGLLWTSMPRMDWLDEATLASYI